MRRGSKSHLGTFMFSIARCAALPVTSWKGGDATAFVGKAEATAYDFFANSPVTVRRDLMASAEMLPTRAFAVRAGLLRGGWN